VLASAEIKRIISALRWSATGTAERDSVRTLSTEDARRAVVMESRDGLEVWVIGESAAFSCLGADRCVVELRRDGLLVAEARGIPAAGTGRVAQALVAGLRQSGSGVFPDEVLDAFDAELRARRRLGWDPLERIVEDPAGEMWLELVAYADRLGLDLDGNGGRGRRYLWQAYAEYTDRVRDELALLHAPAG
jgi:hypothetical protein